MLSRPTANGWRQAYEEWLAFASKQLRELQALGLQVDKIDIEVAALVRWCNSQGQPVDGAARAEYARQGLGGGDLFGTVFSFTTSTAKDLGATGPELAMLAVLFSAAGILGSYFIGTKTAGRIDEKYLLLLAFLLLGAYCFGIAFSRSVIPFFPLQVVAGLANGLLVPSLMAYAIRYVDAGRKSTAMGFYQSVYCLGLTLGPVLMGFLVDHASTRASFNIMALVALACAAAILPVYESNWLARDKKGSAP